MRTLLVKDSARTFADNPVTFVDDVPVTVLCVVCGNISSELLSDPGGHLYCQLCLTRIENDGTVECCVDKAMHSIQDMKKKTDAFLKALDLRAICPKEACAYQATLREVTVHYTKCNVRAVQCPLCQQKVNSKDLARHITDTCEMIPLQCRYCNVDVEACRLKNHMDICDQKPAACSHCKREFTTYAELRDDHLDVCPMRPVKCPYSRLGCNFEAIESDMKKHTGSCKHVTSFVSRFLDLEQKLLDVREENDRLRSITAETEGALRDLRAENNQLINITTETAQALREIKAENEELRKIISQKEEELRGVMQASGHESPALPTDASENAGLLNDSLSKICDLKQELAEFKEAAAKTREDIEMLKAALPIFQGDVSNASQAPLLEILFLNSEDMKVRLDSIQETVNQMNEKFSTDVNELKEQKTWSQGAINHLYGELGKVEHEFREAVRDYFAARDET